MDFFFNALDALRPGYQKKDGPGQGTRTKDDDGGNPQIARQKTVIDKRMWDRIQNHLENPANHANEELQRILDKHPKLTHMRDMEGRTVLHNAIERDADYRKVQVLLDRNPEAAKMALNERLPLHMAMTQEHPDKDILHVLLAYYPLAAKMEDFDGRLPLHIALEHHPFTLSMHSFVEELLHTYPQCTKILYHDNLPLHIALDGSVPSGVVLALIRIHPEAVQTTNGDGRWPLHMVLDRNADLEVLDLLLNTYPAAVLERMSNGPHDVHGTYLPLQKALLKGATQERIMLLADCDTGDLCMQEDDAHFALELALKHGASVHIIQVMLDKHKKAVCIENPSGMLPLHTAMEYKVMKEIILELVNANPAATRTKREASGMFPLHRALQLELSSKVVMSILQEFQNATAFKCKDGKLPLHYAIEYRAGLKIVQAILEIYPKGLKEPDAAGQTPLFVALEGEEQPDVVRLILSLDRHAACHVGKFGWLPLHSAAAHRACLDSIVALVQAYEGGLSIRDHDGRTPLQLAVSRGADQLVVRKLLERCPDAIGWRDKYGRLPLQEAIAKDADGCAVKELLARDQKRAGLSVPDGRGRLPLQQAIHHSAPAKVVHVLIDKAPEQLESLGAVEQARVKTLLESYTHHHIDRQISKLQKVDEHSPRAAPQSDEKGTAEEGWKHARQLSKDVVHIEIGVAHSKKVETRSESETTKDKRLDELKNTINTFCKKQDSFLLNSALAKPGKRLRNTGWSSKNM